MGFSKPFFYWKNGWGTKWGTRLKTIEKGISLSHLMISVILSDLG